MYEKDLEAHKLKFEAEYVIKQPVNNSTDCRKAGEHEVACRVAQHHMKTLDASIRAWNAYINAAYYGGLSFFALALCAMLIVEIGPSRLNSQRPGGQPPPNTGEE
ncbi:hypothetical protein OOT46_00195 [Aquabacterium sp. A7-Y]|uniref:hypothetical protein n=1 Tax=Aquabacterium sp. A7-Y TaxID=1349605 RepID=UPI00223D5799|nr:hypothetical protein [Aquabacterium sp. A7-Y]MCW7536273.1 hypothetical protein [Aquabacterium sp. A7-Y]